MYKRQAATDGSSGSAQAGGEQGGVGGEGGNNAGEAIGGEGGRGGDQENAPGSGSGPGDGDPGGSGADGWAIRKSASGITFTLNNSGEIDGQTASTSSGGSGTSVG